MHEHCQLTKQPTCWHLFVQERVILINVTITRVTNVLMSNCIFAKSFHQ